MAVKTEALEKQVAEVRRVLEAHLKGGLYANTYFDGRIGYALSKFRVTEKDYDGGRYELSTYSRNDRRMSPYAREWCDANGLGDLAKAYDDRALNRYVDWQTGRLTGEREKLAKQLAELDAKIAEWEAKRPQTANNS